MYYKMSKNGFYGTVIVPKSIFEQLKQDFFISHSDDKIKYMCANQPETDHLEALGIELSSVICDWYEIILERD